MKVKPQSSLLSIITIEHEGTIKLLFAYNKQLNDINPPKLYWREKGTVLWLEKNVRQWLAYGSDTDIDSVWNDLITKKKIKVETKEVDISFNSDEEVSEPKKNITKLKYGTNDLPQLILEEDNLLQIEGYSKNTAATLKPLKPPGLLSKGYLGQELSNGYRFVKEERVMFYHFKGNRKPDEVGDVKQMIGFYQGDATANTQVEFLDESGQHSGFAEINHDNGVFKVDLTNPTGKGQIIIKEGDKEIVDYKYVLLKGFSINPEIVSNTFTDNFNRETAIGKRLPPPEKPDNYTWQKGLLASPQDTKIELSDYIKNLLNYLGTDILICDPYFFGKIPPETDDEKESYAIFFNALLTSAVEYSKKSISFLGYWARAKNIIKNENVAGGTNPTKKEAYFNTLKQTLFNVISNSRFQNILSPDKISVINSQTEFHNRYWMGLKEHNGKKVIDTEKIFLVTNSTNGMYASGEIDFIFCDNALQVQRIASKYETLLTASTERFTIG